MKGVLMPIKAGFTMKVFKNLWAVRLGRAITIIGCLLCVFSIVVYYYNWDYIGRAFPEVLPRLVSAEYRIFLTDGEFFRVYELTGEQVAEVLRTDLSDLGYTDWKVCDRNRVMGMRPPLYDVEATDTTIALNPTGDVLVCEKNGSTVENETAIYVVKSKGHLVFHNCITRGY